MPTLKSTINRAVDFGRTMLTAGDLAAALQEDPALCLLLLRQWERRGWLHIKANPLAAKADDICVMVSGYIDDDRPLCDPMSGKM